MVSLSVLTFCALLQVGSESTAPPRIPERQPVPVVQPTPVASAPPVVPMQTVPSAAPPVAPPTAEPKHLSFQNGMLELPKRSRITLAATERAVLTSLKTEQRDTVGNVLRDSTGEPTMIPIAEGMNVFRGQVLGNFDDRELRSMAKINEAQLEVAKAERDKTLEKVVAIHAYRVALAEHLALLEVIKKVPGAVSQFEIQRAELAKVHAEANMELQKYILEEVKTREVVVRESELDQTKLKIELRKLIAPIDGMIVKIGATEGEWLREGDPVLEIVQLDTMWVKVQVHADKYAVGDLYGKQATIQVALANGKTEKFSGAVVFCDPHIEAGNTFWAYIEVQNRRLGNFWLLQPGRGNVEIEIPL